MDGSVIGVWVPIVCRELQRANKPGEEKAFENGMSEEIELGLGCYR